MFLWGAALKAFIDANLSCVEYDICPVVVLLEGVSTGAENDNNGNYANSKVAPHLRCIPLCYLGTHQFHTQLDDNVG